jgi:cell division ATPase FtsA
VLYGGKVRYIASIPIGANSINNDIRSLSIPSNYIEDLKIQYGSAISDLAIDDMIVFQAAKCRLVKNILRKNLAIVIEARLKEIAEWIRGEIKEAGCGSKFMPTLLLTGGGSQMRDIEHLFSRELDIAEVRVVHPEYGFTEESMLEHITSPADATVASLLVYGAKLGSCTIGQPTEQPKDDNDNGKKGLSDYDNVAPKDNQSSEQTPVQTPVQTPATDELKNPVKQKKTIVDDDDPLEQKEKKSLGVRIRKLFRDMGNTFIGDSEEGDF